MVNAALQREIKVLKERQGRLERLLYSILPPKMIEGNEEIRPSYLRKIERISRDLDQGKGRAFNSATEMRNWLKHL